MYIFIDTEFTCLSNPKLISIGLVADSGVHFYGELTHRLWREHASDFVQSEVIPLLDFTRHGLGDESPKALAKRLSAWFLRIGEPCIIASDSDYDWQLFNELFVVSGVQWPGNVERFHCPIWLEPDDSARIEHYLSRYGLPRHHALNDARALRFAFNARKR